MGYKGDFLSGSTTDIGFGGPAVGRKIKKIGRLLTDSAEQRVGVGEFGANIGRDQRNWADLRIRPIEKSLSEVIRNRLSAGGQDQRIATAQQGTMEAFDRAGEGATRNAARYGVQVDPSTDRGFGLDRTKSAIMAGNLAGQTDRDAALQDADRFYQNGAGLPGTATQEHIAGAGSLADQNDYNTGRKVGEYMGQGEAFDSIGQGWANAMSGMADGGEVGGVGIRREMGGTTGETIRLSQIHRREYGEGKTDKQFGEWLAENGYELGQDNMARHKRGYAGGGGIGLGIGGNRGRVLDGDSERVELNTGDFIVPEQAVEFYGREFWDKQVVEHGGEVEDDGYARGGEVRHADDGEIEDDGTGFGIQVSGNATRFNDDGGHGTNVNGRVGYRTRLGDGDITAGASLDGINAKFQTPEGTQKVKELSVRDVDVNYKKGQNTFGANVGRGHVGVNYRRDFADGGGVGLGAGIERGYASSLGPVVGAIKTGLTAGLLDARQTEEHDMRMANNLEDRTYLRGEREYQGKQRQKAEQKDVLDRELAMATSEFMRKDGTDLTPIINVQRKHFGADGTVNFAPNADGKTYKISSLRADGSEESPARDIGLDELRKIGVGMIKTMRDPKTLEDIWKKNEHWTSYGGGLGLLETKSGRVKPGLDPETLLSVRGRQPAGPKAVHYPQRGMILDAEDMLKSDPDLANLSEDDRKALSVNVASRAQALLTEQPGIDASEAIAQALDEERANVAPGEKRDLFGIDWLARDKAPAYQDRRRAAPVAPTPAEQALKTKAGAPARNTAPPSANEPTAVNPRTGERLVLRNGQWQPLK